MTPTSRDYAALAEDAYRDRAVGRRAPGEAEQVDIGGVRYLVREHVDNPRTGYQGTIYQRVDSHDMIVAHRGTEQIVRDGLITDGAMVVGRLNPQAADAIALTQRAVQMAAIEARQRPSAPQVTVTGHSLGGTLAQISAHHFDLKGETFNAYGAASLGYRIPEGGDRVLNHVMASDPVSAASPHYGQVRIYARPDEIAVLSSSGYSNSRFNSLIPDSPVLAAGRSLGAHKMSNFVGAGAVLDDPAARALADDNRRMIAEYRQDLDQVRSGITVIGRGPVGNAVDLIDKLRGPLPAGAPAQRDAPAPQARSLRIDQPGHAGHGLFLQAREGVLALDAQAGRSPDAGSERLAGSLAARMQQAGGQRIDHVVLSADAARAFAVQGRLDDPAQLRVVVDTLAAMNTPLERSSERVASQAAAPALHALQPSPPLRAQG